MKIQVEVKAEDIGELVGESITANNLVEWLVDDRHWTANNLTQYRKEQLIELVDYLTGKDNPHDLPPVNTSA